MEPVSLREANQEDSLALLAVILSAFQDYEGRLDPPSGAHGETAETIRQKIDNGGGVIALVNQKIVGCVLYEPAHDHIYLGRLAVLPSYRRRGIGRKLVAWVERQARAQRYTRVRVAVRLVLTDNRAFFERLGYRVLSYGRHPGHVDPTYVNLEKDVTRDAYIN